jgi:hypothetical protein
MPAAFYKTVISSAIVPKWIILFLLFVFRFSMAMGVLMLQPT